MTNNPNKTIAVPEMADLADAIKRDLTRSLNCVKIGRIERFDATKKTAEIQILFKRVTPGGIVSYPLLVDCPVFTLQGGGGAVQMPVQAGDACIVLFADRSIDIWFSNGSEAAPDSARCHDLSDGIALVGINAGNSTMAAYDTNVNIRVPDGKKLVVSSTGSATAEIFGASALALLSELQTLVTWCRTHTHPSNGSAATQAGTLADPTGTAKLKGA